MIALNDEKINLMNFDEKRMRAFVQQYGEPVFRAQQLLQWIHQHGVTDFQQMTNLSKAFRQRLQAEAMVQPLQVITAQQGNDGTRKWLFRVPGGNAVETVFIPESTRGTLCISSQVGCALNCSFCATGKEGFNRNLGVAEIIGQLWHAVAELTHHQNQTTHRITNVVMMGMGEPLLNYDNVLAALNLMMSDYGYNLSKYRVTVSTSGVIPAIQRLRMDSQAALAVSLHAPNDALRNQLVPLNKKYPLAQLMAVCRDYFANEPRRKITFEYVMLKDVNDTLGHAKQLIQLLQDIPCKINLIPFNPFPKTRYECSSFTTIEQFQQCLMRAGILTWVRKTRGDDIDGACGQLAGKVQDRTGRHLRWQQTGHLIPILAAE